MEKFLKKILLHIFSQNKWIMKGLFSLKNRLAFLFSITFVTSLVVSKLYTDTNLLPKDFFFFISSGVFILAVCLANFYKKFTTKFVFSWIDISIIGFILFSFVRILFTPGISVDNIQFYLFLINGILYFLIKPVLFESDKQDSHLPAETVINILLIIVLVQVIWGFLQYFHIMPNSDQLYRMGGAFGNPGQYANFITPLLSFTLSVFLFSKKSNRTLGLIATIGIIAILPFTQARTAWIGALLVIFYLAEKKYLILVKCSGFLKSAFVKTMVVIILALMVVTSGFFIYNLKKNSSSGRLFIWQVSATMIKERPLWGYGFDRFAAAHNDYQALYFKEHPDDMANAAVADGVNYAFNEFIQVTVETGAIGLILLIALFVFAFRAKVENRTPENEEKNMYLYGAKGSIIAILVSMMFSYPLHTVPSLIILFFSLALVASEKNRKIFEITLWPSSRKGLSLAGIGLILIFLVFQINRNKAERSWLKGFQMMRHNQHQEAYKLYRELYPKLTYNQFFLFNYGAELLLMKRYDESIELLKEAELRVNNSDLHQYMGYSYENINNYKLAEQCYLKSSEIMPLKFFPKSRLVEIYMKTGRKKEAIQLAKNILALPVKVRSKIIDDIRQDMIELVKNQ
jgi:O-antigen polymerase